MKNPNRYEVNVLYNTITPGSKSFSESHKTLKLAKEAYVIWDKLGIMEGGIKRLTLVDRVQERTIHERKY